MLFSSIYGCPHLQFTSPVSCTFGLTNFACELSLSMSDVIASGELMWIRPSRVHDRLKDYPLHRCAAQGDADSIRHYLQQGWSVTQRDVDSFTPIHHAAKW